MWEGTGRGRGRGGGEEGGLGAENLKYEGALGGKGVGGRDGRRKRSTGRGRIRRG